MLSSHVNAQVFTYVGSHYAFSRHDGAHFDAKAATIGKQRTWSFFTAVLRTRDRAQF